MNKVIDKGFRSCRFVSTIVKHPVCLQLHIFRKSNTNFAKTDWAVFDLSLLLYFYH